MNVARNLNESAPSGRYAFHVARTGAAALVISARGEIDAANTGQLAEIVQCALPAARRLVLDFSGVTFFAVEGFSALQRIKVMCARVDVGWVLIPSAPVLRVLGLCSAPAGADGARLRLVSGG